MKPDFYPEPRSVSMVERVPELPGNRPTREWVLRDDNRQHYHGCVRLSESPLTLRLCWKACSEGSVIEIGLFRLHLPELLNKGMIRHENGASMDEEVRLRFYRGDAGVIYIQTRLEGPRVAVGHVEGFSHA